MRNISASSLVKLAQNLGTEPINILEIQWVDGGARDSYADRDIDPGVKGRILEVSDLDAIIQISGGSDSQEISVVLDDIDGSLKNIMDTIDIHKRPVWVYQWFDGIPLSDRFLLFKGFISSPIVWNEGARHLSFTVISRIESIKIGFSIEEGDIPNPPKDLIGKPWPLCFGTPVNVPALQVQSIRQGTLVTGVGIADPTLANQIKIAEETCCPLKFYGYVATYPNGIPGSLLITPQYAEDPECLRQKCLTLENLEFQLEQQTAFQYPTFTVDNGDEFPQGVTITLDIEGAKFTGQFNGNVFTIFTRTHPGIDDDYCIPETVPQTGQCQVFVGNEIVTLTPVPIELDPVPGIPTCPEVDPETTDCGNVTTIGLTDQQQEVLLNPGLKPLNFFWANPGSKVTLAGSEEIIYIANLLPSTILRVAAVRNFRSGPELVTVPSEYYTIRQTNYNSYQVVEIVFSSPLSRRQEEGEDAGWTDDVYVTLTSSVGPNTVDILRWLIEFYTDFQIDNTSFNAVRSLVDNYPMHFAVYKDRPDLIQILEDIAYQARCAIWLRDDTFFLKYLPLDPPIDDTFAATDIDQNSFEIFHTDTEELVTRSEITWRSDYYVEETQRANLYIVNHNVSKYGTQEETADYFTFKDYTLVQKTGTFWIIRRANTWRKVRFTTPLHKLRIEVFDCISVSLSHLAPNPIKCIVEKASYDSENQKLQFEAWTPLKSGTTVPYDFAWPATLSELAIFPTPDEVDNSLSGVGDDNPNFEVIAPSGHPLSATPPQGFGGFQLQGEDCSSNETALVCQGARTDAGGKHPSDVGDQKPVSTPPSGFGIDPNTANAAGVGNRTGTQTNASACCEELQEKIDTLEKQVKELQAQNPEQVDEGAEEDLPSCDDVPCKASVTVQYTTITQVARDGGFHMDGCGIPTVGIGSLTTYCFGSVAAAQAFKDAAEAEAAGYGSERCVGTRYIVTVTAISTSGMAPGSTDCGGDSFDEEGNPIVKGQSTTDL